uniref:NADP-dependent oxidoreductase domain-containing protein n=1 Tax=Panagrolaimus sp. JU765 TaxID=591449 RepID=A0AC34RH19_9BILA
MPKIPTVKMTNGLELPLFGYGTWQAQDEQQLKTALKVALESGYRLIDTAYAYGNEQIIGEVLQEFYKSGKLKREDVFITTKLPPFNHHPENVPKSVDEQLKKLQTDYIDLFLIHTPCPNKGTPTNLFQLDSNGQVIEDPVDHIDTWKSLEKLYKLGILKSIGLSNFNEQQI